ncbi:hypothetical protein ACLMJK_006440 [Lecanora helva]
MVKNPFKNLSIAITGDFGEKRGPEKMKEWIQVNGGKFAPEISSNVTHLICSKRHYKENVTMVQQARRLRSVKIVSFDWLEDSLMSRMRRNEREYLMGPHAKLAALAKAKKKKTRRKNIAKGMEIFEKCCKEFEKDMFSDGYGIYQDSNQFNYDITLARANLLTNTNERYALKVCHSSYSSVDPLHKSIFDSQTACPFYSPTISSPIFPMYPPSPRPRARIVSPRAQRLQLFVSHATPKTFACNVKYSSPGTEPVHEPLAPIGSTWDTAWAAFKAFFKLKTKKDWDMRFMKYDLGPEAFVYAPPREGQPQGLFMDNTDYQW